MPRITYYVAVPFVRAENGDVVPSDEGKEAPSADGARKLARLYAAEFGGGIAFSRTGDPDLGEFEPAQILAQYGETPDEVE